MAKTMGTMVVRASSSLLGTAKLSVVAQQEPYVNHVPTVRRLSFKLKGERRSSQHSKLVALVAQS